MPTLREEMIWASMSPPPPVKRRFTSEEIESLVSSPLEANPSTPSIFEIVEALDLFGRRDPIMVFVMKRRLRWLTKKVRKHYGVEWITPWSN